MTRDHKTVLNSNVNLKHWVSGVMIWLYIECLHKFFLRFNNFSLNVPKIQGKFVFTFTGDYGKIQ